MNINKAYKEEGVKKNNDLKSIPNYAARKLIHVSNQRVYQKLIISVTNNNRLFGTRGALLLDFTVAMSAGTNRAGFEVRGSPALVHRTNKLSLYVKD